MCLQASLSLLSLLTSALMYAQQAPSPSGVLQSKLSDVRYAASNPKIIDQQGNAIGHAYLLTTSNGSLVGFSVCNLPRGWHGVHIHNKGDCDDYVRGFKSAGDIYNPNFLNHGYAHDRTKAGYRIGDMANVYVGNEPCIHIEQLIPDLNKAALRGQIKGLALIIHANADDYSTQPQGDAGERLACAVLKRR